MRTGKRKNGEKHLSMRECFEILLRMPVQGEHAEELAAMGLKKKDIDNRMLLAATLFRRAVDTKDTGAIKEIRSILGDSDNEGMGDILRLIEGLKSV